MALYCEQQADNDMVDVLRTCRGHEVYTKRPTFGAEGNKAADYYYQHAQDGLVDVKNRRCGY